jgi:hypothetical protein
MMDGNLGLDELMIVNPIGGSLRALFLGGDGGLYSVEAADADGGFFLGGDGSVYRIGAGDLPSRYFLGGDGALYRLT